jgi:hypothetical protein
LAVLPEAKRHRSTDPCGEQGGPEFRRGTQNRVASQSVSLFVAWSCEDFDLSLLKGISPPLLEIGDDHISEDLVVNGRGLKLQAPHSKVPAKGEALGITLSREERRAVSKVSPLIKFARASAAGRNTNGGKYGNQTHARRWHTTCSRALSRGYTVIALRTHGGTAWTIFSFQLPSL